MATELSIAGVVDAQLYPSILNRLANHAHSFAAFHSAEIGFQRAEPSEDTNILRLKHTTRHPQIINNHAPANYKNPLRNGCSLTAQGRIEPERLSPEFSIRPIHFCPIIAGDPLEFLSALGYRRGVQFVRGGVVIEIFRVYQSEKDETAIAGEQTYLITVTAIIPTLARSTTTTTTPAATGPSVQELRSEACARIREIQAILKGLADLGRVEPF
ncbi:hypothetical protein PtA15_6A197 [Puccinia triticina]|uniref:Mediator of RNA polymerase II transcription subunit 18 n=1 Tax=Puccinia triticina TaxID=208348 RepID=A0ABY7CLM8_9BASI|nr:uncharacterized protein PtA15_6A197 [Puccinia triticina]WAQ85569.1 hypothetical protein PtA15_6A197 [Puccinia triticina]